MSEEKTFNIKFQDTNFAPLKAKAGIPLPEILNHENSPILFGCCNGVCGACVIEIYNTENLEEANEEASEEERETLELFDFDPKNHRLACQLKLNKDLKIKVPQ